MLDYMTGSGSIPHLLVISLLIAGLLATAAGVYVILNTGPDPWRRSDIDDSNDDVTIVDLMEGETPGITPEPPRLDDKVRATLARADDTSGKIRALIGEKQQ